MTKPSDDPSFFYGTLRPKESRETSIVLDAEGRFSHDGSLIEHPGILSRFHAWIDRHPGDGRYILNNGYDWVYFAVSDVPFLVTGVRQGAGGLLLTLTGATEELLDPRTLSVGARGALYLQVKQGRFSARFTVQGQLELAPWLAEGPGGTAVLVVGAERYPIG